jgi:polyphosphate kinase
LKTHCKLCLIVRREGSQTAAGALQRYCHLSTGNYNDRTAQFYGDLGLLTCRETICGEVEGVFNLLTGYAAPESYTHLLVAPEHLRHGVIARIRREAENAKIGKPAAIIAKMNSLVDTEIIDALYLASRAGVRIQLIIRGICCLRPGVPGLSENIRVISILDRFLEHARIFIFENAGQREYFLSSADWMPRNLDRRVEVAFPIYDTRVQQQIQEIIDTQLNDNVKARVLLADNTCVMNRNGQPPLRAQEAHYQAARS